MESKTSIGYICLKNKYNIEFRLCKLTYLINEDETFKYVFEPNYSIIDLLDTNDFQGIPGLNLDLRKKEYIRENINPVFLKERVPQPNREDYMDYLQMVNLDYMDPIEYLIRTPLQYFGDRFYMVPYEDKKVIDINNIIGKSNTNEINGIILKEIAKGNEIIINNETINDTNRKIVFFTLFYTYKRYYDNFIKTITAGIENAKKNNKYKGRKPIKVDMLKFNELIKQNKSCKEICIILKISRDKYYRLKKPKSKVKMRQSSNLINYKLL